MASKSINEVQDKGSRSVYYCARCGRVKEICLHCLQETGVLRRHLSTRRPVYPSTCLPVYMSTSLPVCGSLLLKHLSSRQGESEDALLCKMWQGKGDMSALFTGIGDLRRHLSTCQPVYLLTCLSVYMSTCLLVYLSNCGPVYLSTCRPVYPSTCLPVNLQSCLPVYPSTCLPVDLSTVPYF